MTRLRLIAIPVPERVPRRRHGRAARSPAAGRPGGWGGPILPVMVFPPDAPGDQETLQLIGGIARGDESAWRRLYDLYHDELLFFIRRSLGKRLRAQLESEDVFQSVALAAFRDLPRFAYRGKGSLRAYLHRMVLNKIRDRAAYFGAEKRRGAVPLTDSVAARAATEPAEPAYRRPEIWDALERALDALPEEQREIVVLRRLEGLSSREIAAKLGKSDAAVRKAYSRALAKLTLSLEARDDAPCPPNAP